MPGARTRVLTNVLELQGNPYLSAWNEASRRAGARTVPLGARSVLARGGDRAAWVHLQWPERVLDPESARRAARRTVKLLLLVALARARRTRVLLTMHNVVSHSRRHPALERVLWRALGVLVTDVHLLSAAGRPEVIARHPGLRRARFHVVPHGDYRSLAMGAPDRAAARAALGLDDDLHVLVTFGYLRGYKGVEELIDAFRRHRDATARLVVAGRVDGEALRARLEQATALDPRVELRLGFLPDDELATLVRASDGVVLPYRRILNSGSALLALSLDRPVLLPRTPTFEALAAGAGERWVACFAGPLEPRHLAALRIPGGGGRPDLSWCSWERVAELLEPLWAGEPAGAPPA